MPGGGSDSRGGLPSRSDVDTAAETLLFGDASELDVSLGPLFSEQPKDRAATVTYKINILMTK